MHTDNYDSDLTRKQRLQSCVFETKTDIATVARMHTHTHTHTQFSARCCRVGCRRTKHVRNVYVQFREGGAICVVHGGSRICFTEEPRKKETHTPAQKEEIAPRHGHSSCEPRGFVIIIIIINIFMLHSTTTPPKPVFSAFLLLLPRFHKYMRLYVYVYIYTCALITEINVYWLCKMRLLAVAPCLMATCSQSPK